MIFHVNAAFGGSPLWVATSDWRRCRIPFLLIILAEIEVSTPPGNNAVLMSFRPLRGDYTAGWVAADPTPSHGLVRRIVLAVARRWLRRGVGRGAGIGYAPVRYAHDRGRGSARHSAGSRSFRAVRPSQQPLSTAGSGADAVVLAVHRGCGGTEPPRLSASPRGRRGKARRAAPARTWRRCARPATSGSRRCDRLRRAA